MKKYLLTTLLILFANPSWAHSTQPEDTVSVVATTYNGDTQTSHKVYRKPWSQIKIDAKSIEIIDALIKRYIALNQDPDQAFRIAHLTITNNNVHRAIVMSDYGTALALDLSANRYCYASVAGNGLVNSACPDP